MLPQCECNMSYDLLKMCAMVFRIFTIKVTLQGFFVFYSFLNVSVHFLFSFIAKAQILSIKQALHN